MHTTRVSGRRWAPWAQSRSPSTQRNDFFSSRALVPLASGSGGRGGVESGPQHPQRHPLGVDRQCRVQVQPARQRPGLVRANRAQPLGLAAPGEVHAGAVEDTQHRGLRLHALQRARAMGGEDVLDCHLALGGLVDEPVMSLDHRTRSVRSAGDGAHRRECHMVRALDQARAQARIAQRRPAELVPRPAPGVDSVAGRQRGQAGGGQGEALAPCRFQLMDVHRLARLGGGMGAVLAPAPGALPDPDPVRRAQARPGVLALVDERLQQPGPVAVETLEVLAQRPRHPAQDMGGEIAAPHTGANQEPAQPHHPVQVGAALCVVPAHPGVAGVEPARRGGEPHRAQPAVGGADQIAHLRTHERTRTARMLISHQGVPDPALRVGLDPHQRKLAHLPDRARHTVCRRHSMGEHPRAVSPGAVMSGRRQCNVAPCLQHAQRLAATCALPPAASVAQVKCITDPVGDLSEARRALSSRAVEHIAKSGKIGPQAAPDLILHFHAAHGSAADS